MRPPRADTELLQKAERVQGNPFLLVEFFRGLQDDRIVSVDRGRATLIEDPVNELIRAEIFADGGQLAFRHDIIRVAIRGSLLPPVRRAIDRQAADVLLARGALPIEVAIQLVENAEPGDDVAIGTALKATHVLGGSDPAAAAELAAKALFPGQALWCSLAGLVRAGGGEGYPVAVTQVISGGRGSM